MGAAGVGMPPVSLCRWSGAALSVLRGGLSTRRKSSFQSWLRVRTTWEVWQGLMPGTYCPPPKSHFIGFPGGSDTKEFAAVQATQVRSLGLEDPLEKRVVSHSSIFVWRIPWIEEPGGLQSMEL